MFDTIPEVGFDFIVMIDVEIGWDRFHLSKQAYVYAEHISCLCLFSDPPDVSVTTETVDFFRGNNITLKCLARGEPEQYTFDKWLHVAPDNYTEIETLVGKQNKGENILVLKNVTYMDSGIYVCRVTNNITIGTIKFGKADKQISVKGNYFYNCLINFILNEGVM